MKKEVIKSIENFVIRVSKGGEAVSPQETAILPDMVELLDRLPANNEPAGDNYSVNNS